MNPTRWNQRIQCPLRASHLLGVALARTSEGTPAFSVLCSGAEHRRPMGFLRLILLVTGLLLQVSVAAAAPVESTQNVGATSDEPGTKEPGPARAWTAAAVASLAKQLGDADSERRVAAFDALRSAPAFAFDALRAHAESQLLGKDGPSSATLAAQEARFRHALGLFRADVFEDIAPGARIALRKDATFAPGAERVAVMRALEANALHAEAPALLLKVLAAHSAAWSWEAHRVAKRIDVRLAPALYRMVTADERGARLLARKVLGATGLEVPSTALLRASGEDVPLHTLRELITVLGAQRHISAMEDLRTYLTDPRPSVRRAAWVASGHFRKDFIWQYRKLYEVEFGEQADTGLGHARLRTLLEQHVESRLRPDAGDAIERAQQLAKRNDLQAMDAALEPLWSSDPRAIPEAFAVSYQRLAKVRSDAGDLRGAAESAWRAALLVGLDEATESDGADAATPDAALPKMERAISAALVLEGDAALATAGGASAVPNADAAASDTETASASAALHNGRFWQYYWQAARGMTADASALQRLGALSGEQPWFSGRKRRALGAGALLVASVFLYQRYWRRRERSLEPSLDEPA